MLTFTFDLMPPKWSFGVAAGIILAVICLSPQIEMICLRGSDWNGHYAYNDIDEVAYAAYVRALIDGRPRKNDPYTGRDNTIEDQQPETLFSIQFAAPYTLAIPARTLGISTPSAMILAGAIAAFFSAFAVFWILENAFGDRWFSLAGTLGVFCFGTIAAGEGAILELLFDRAPYPSFPGFRRYVPAIALPAFFAFVGILWKATGGRHGSAPRPISALLAALCFAYLVYSYFYLWATAAAFIFCLIAVWSVARPPGWAQAIKQLLFIGLLCTAAALPYVYLLSGRSETFDEVQLLVSTRTPDLFRFPEYIAAAVVLMLMIGLATKRVERNDPRALFAFSLALTVFAVFNQQILTGLSLQPIHFQVFVGNYVVVLALFFGAGAFLSGMNAGRIATNIFRLAALAAIAWGSIEIYYTTRQFTPANVMRDELMPIGRRLANLATTEARPHDSTVLSFDLILADELPTIAPQNVIWAHHQSVFATLSAQEYRERFMKYLYYLNIDEGGLEYALRNDDISMIALFGWDRHSDRLSSRAVPLTQPEIDAAVERYREFRASFDRSDAVDPQIAYVIVPLNEAVDLKNIEKWYELDAGEQIGSHMLFQTRLK